MRIKSTEIQNNFGKFLRLSVKEDIIISKNGKDIAKLIGFDENDIGQECIKEPEYAYSTKGTRISYEEFLEIAGNSDQRFEYIDGEIYLLASPKVTHQNVLMELMGIFYNYFRGKSCRPAVSPFDVTLKRNEDNINIVQPDLMVLCDMDENINEQDYYVGTPTLVVEIISESSRKMDYIKKLDLYLDCGIKEYWIVNPFSKEITCFEFSNKEIQDNITFRLGEKAKSYIFADLVVDMKSLFVNQ